MSILRRYSRAGNRAPRGPFVLNKDSPQAQGLLLWYPLGPFNKFREFIRGEHVAFEAETSLAISTDLGGQMVSHGTTATEKTSIKTSDLGINGAAAKTVMCWAKTPLAGGDTEATLFRCGQLGTEGRDFTLKRVGPTTWRVVHWAGADYDFTLDKQGKMGHFALSYNGSISRISADGIERNNKTVALDTGDIDISLGHWNDNFSWEDLWGDFRIYNKDVGKSVIYQAWSPDTRWDLYYELGRRTFYTVPAVGGPSTFPAAMATGL